MKLGQVARKSKLTFRRCSLLMELRSLVLRTGAIQFLARFAEVGGWSVINLQAITVCKAFGVDVPLKTETPIGIVCDWLADNGNFDTAVHKLLISIRDAEVANG